MSIIEARAIVLTLDLRLSTLSSVALHALLFLGALGFWTPVLGSRPIDPAARFVYLILCAPSPDLAAVFLVARGNTSGGLAMIVGMLPLSLYAVAATWRWLTEEERAADAANPQLTASGE